MFIGLEDLRVNCRIALVSVYNKDNIVDRVRRLVDLGYGILSSGGTADELDRNGIEVCRISTLTGMEAIMKHKVVTLHPKVHGGLLADRSEIGELEDIGGVRIDLVAIDLYPLEEEIAKPEATRESVIAKTDIGGPTMLSSAAKGSRIVIPTVEDWGQTLDWMEAGYPDFEETVNAQRAKADFVVAKYRMLSATYHSGGKYVGVFSG